MASQAVYVDLDLKGNTVLNVKAPTNGPDATNKTYVDTADQALQAEIDAIGSAGLDAKADKTTTITAGSGLVGGGDLSADRTLAVFTTPGSGLGIDANGLWVDVGEGLSRSAAGVSVNIGTGLVAGDAGNDYVTVDQAWLDNEIATKSQANLTAGSGIDIAVGGDLATPDTVSAKLSGNANNILVFGTDQGLYVPADAAIDFPVDDVVGTTAQVVVTPDANDVFTVSLDPAITSAISGNTAAIATKANSSVTLTAGNGLAGGGDLTQNRGFDVVAANTTILSGGSGVQVGVIQSANIAAGAVGNTQLADGAVGTSKLAAGAVTDNEVATGAGILQGKIEGRLAGNTTLNEDVDDLQSQIDGLTGTVDAIDYPVDVIAAGANTTVTPSSAGGIDTWTVGLDAATSLQVHPAATGTAGQITVSGAQAIGIDTAFTDGIATDISDAISAHEAAADPHTGYQLESEKGANNGYASLDGAGLVPLAQLPALPLANTYSGPAADVAGINADLVSQAVTSVQPGDLYVSTAGFSAINTVEGDPAGGTPVWVEMAAQSDVVNQINGLTGSVTIDDVTGETAVSTGGGIVTVGLDAAFVSRVADLETDSHVAAVSGNAAIGVVAGTQAVSLVTSPSSTELSVAADGLAINLSAYALDTDLHPAATNGAASAISVDGPTQVVSLLLDATGSTELTQSGAGLKVDLSAYAKSTAVAAGDAALQAELDATQAGAGLSDLGSYTPNAGANYIAAVGSLNAADVALDTALKAEETARTGADNTLSGRLDVVEGKHPAPQAVTLTGGTLSQVIAGPAGAAVTVRDAGGCIVTLSVCETAPGSYTVSSNLDFTGTIAFG